MVAIIKQDRLLRWSSAVGVVLILTIAILYISPVYKAVGETAVTWFYELLTIFFAALATGLMGRLWRTFERGEPLWAVWGSLMLGMLLWTLGEIIWSYYDLILTEEVPYPSVADVAWVIGYIPLFVGFFLRFRSLQTMPTRREFLMGGSAFLLLLVLAVVFVIGPIVTDKEYGSRAEQIINILYPVGDLGIVFVAMLSVFVLAGGELSYPWLVLASGFLITAVADLMYLYAVWNDLYLAGAGEGTNLATAAADIPYFAAYVVIAFAMVMQARLRR